MQKVYFACCIQILVIHDYRLDTVNSKLFVSKVLLQTVADPETSERGAKKHEI